MIIGLPQLLNDKLQFLYCSCIHLANTIKDIKNMNKMYQIVNESLL